MKSSYKRITVRTKMDVFRDFISLINNSSYKDLLIETFDNPLSRDIY